MLLDECCTINIDSWQKVELLISKYLLIPMIILHNCLMQELEAEEEWHLHGEEFTGVGCTGDHNGVAGIACDLGYFGRLGDVEVGGVNLGGGFLLGERVGIFFLLNWLWFFFLFFLLFSWLFFGFLFIFFLFRFLLFRFFFLRFLLFLVFFLLLCWFFLLLLLRWLFSFLTLSHLRNTWSSIFINLIQIINDISTCDLDKFFAFIPVIRIRNLHQT